MINFINKNKLLATTAICAISICANTVKAEEISIIEILNNSTTKSPDITWTVGQEGGENTIKIDDVYFKYAISANPTRTKYDERKTDLTGDVTADFIGSEDETSSNAYGGAIDNSGTIESITGDFISNGITSTNYNTYGGAVYNSGTINDIKGTFTDNSVTGNYADGGAINNHGTILNITGDFIANSTSTANGTTLGGAIYNSDSSTIGDIVGNFINNSTTSKNSIAYGGAISNSRHSKIESITGNFTNNSANSITYNARGGAILNYGTIKDIYGEFTGNSANSTNYSFITSYYNVEGGAIYNYGGTIETITGNFTNNSAVANGTSAYGGAIYNKQSTINEITGTFTDNSVESIGANAYGGAIYHYNSSQNVNLTGDFIANHVIVANGAAYGGAIYNSRGTITLIADALDSTDTLQNDILFKGNYIEVDGDRQYEAIYNEGSMNFESNNGGSFTFYDYINGNDGTLNFVSDDDENAAISLYNNIQNQKEINFQSAYVMNMLSPDDIHQDVFTSKCSYIQAQNININAALQMMLDVDLENAEMDRFEADNFTIADGGSINVVQLNIVQDATVRPTDKIEVPFIVIDDISKATGLDKISTNITEVIGTNYTYSVTFNPETGAFEFVSTGLAPKPVTPAPEEVAPNQAPVLSTTTTVTTVETVVTQIFERDVTISADTNYGSDTTDYMETSDGVNIHNDKSVWVKTFGSDDDVEIDNFNGTIDAEAYGVVGGVDSKVFKYDNGVKAAYGVYGAYVGGKQKYNDSKITQDSGYLGVSASFRKNNLFSNFTLNGGYITSEANTAWGKDKFDTKTISVANKTGVDIKTHNNWKITPALYVAYTGMDTEDYTNKAGVKMENEFSNVITIAPELKVSNRIGKDLDGYAKVSYKHYIYDAEVRADDVLLEEMSAKPYVEYGFGVEKNWADKSGYFELTRRSGGREGWNVNLGLNFDF